MTLPTVNGASFFAHEVVTYTRRGLRWYVSQKDTTAIITVEGRGVFTWQRHFMTTALYNAITATIDRLYFTEVQSTARENHTTPIDGVPWEIHDLENLVAYEAALYAYKENTLTDD